MGMKASIMKRSRDLSIALCGFILVFAACFCFFQLCYQQHLLHREQNNLFLYSWQYIAENYHGVGWLSSLMGDFLTQYFYYIGAGAAILAFSMSVLWVLAYAILLQCFRCASASWAHLLSLGVASVLVLWEALRETGPSFQFSSTISLITILLILNIIVRLWRMRRAIGFVAAILLLPAGIWCFGSFNGRWLNIPDFDMERLMAIDNAAYFGNWDKVLRLSGDMPEARLAVFYHSLANARKGQLTESIKDKMYLGPEILLPVVGPSSSYMRIGAAGRAWHMIGDYTMAEHCYMLSMIFSPRSTGARHLRELAQVNIDNGDCAAAEKYLRMLSQTAAHSRWANDKLRQLAHAPMQESQHCDTLRAANDMIRSLRFALQKRPDNAIAYDYLMNYHLTVGNMSGLIADYDSKMPNHQWYQQALLIALSQSDEKMAKALEYGVSPSILSEYAQYVDQYLKCNGNMAAMQPRFGDTYWYHYHITEQSR